MQTAFLRMESGAISEGIKQSFFSTSEGFFIIIELIVMKSCTWGYYLLRTIASNRKIPE